MSFAERHKRWLLPLLGLALAGVVWLNLRAGAADALPASEAAPPAGEPEERQETPSPEPGRPDPGEADLRALEAPSAEDNDVLPLLLAGRQPLTGDLRAGTRRPELHPGLWAGLAQPPAQPAPAPEAAPAPAALPRAIDFLLESGDRQEAWVGGRGYRPGDVLPGGYVLRRLTPGGAVLAGPGGERLLPLNSNPSAPAPGPAPGDHP